MKTLQFELLTFSRFPVFFIFMNISVYLKIQSVHPEIIFTRLQNRIPLEIMSRAWSSSYIGINLLSQIEFRKLPRTLFNTFTRTCSHIFLFVDLPFIVSEIHKLGWKITFDKTWSMIGVWQKRENYPNICGNKIFEDVRFEKHSFLFLLKTQLLSEKLFWNLRDVRKEKSIVVNAAICTTGHFQWQNLVYLGSI